MSSDYYSEAIESMFRTIRGAQPDLRRLVFKMQAPDVFELAADAGIDKVDISDRFEAVGIEFGWPPDQRQTLIAAAIRESEDRQDAGDDADNSNIDGVSGDEPAGSESSQEEIVTPPQFSDDAIGLRFAECHDDLRYVAKFDKWFVWNGNVWREDDTLIAPHLVRRTCRTVAAGCNDQPRVAKAIASAKTVTGVERLAQSDRRLAATADQFDRDPYALNTPAGIFDLRSGRIQPHDRKSYLTKITGVAPDFTMPTPVFNGFTHRISDGHDELVAYLQRVAGYTLTGSTQEHALFFCYGVGANGKSTFLNAITAAAGDYHRPAPIETFTASHHDRHPTELAGLRGARLVTAIETEDGRRWAESKIKSLTGGDPISARFMRQDFFEYTPQFKLIIAGNHKPSLRSVDEAIRRRFNLIPFAVIIPPGERDGTLPDKLKSELPGILAWMIAGCSTWRERGLCPPKIVTDATAAYLESEDALSAWFEDMAVREANSFMKSSDLFVSWTVWAEKAGEYVGSLKRFSQALETRGFTPHRHRQLGRGFTGIRLADRSSE